MEFGLSINSSAAPGADPVDDARRAEAMGFDFVSVTDHLHGTRPTFETWTLLTWIAATTSRVGLLTDVLGLPYRAPAVLAKMAESLSRLSGGRLILGLGGGGSDDEFRGFGLGVRTPGEKIEALRESLDVIQGLWREPHFTYEGRHYRTDRAELEPKPEDLIPIWLGVYGPRALRLAGERADGWIPSLPFSPPPVRKAMQERVRAAAAAAGRDPDELVYAYNLGIHVGPGAEGRPNVVSGSPEQVIERLSALIADGVTALNFWPVGDQAEQQERLAKEIVPALRTTA